MTRDGLGRPSLRSGLDGLDAGSELLDRLNELHLSLAARIRLDGVELGEEVVSWSGFRLRLRLQRPQDADEDQRQARGRPKGEQTARTSERRRLQRPERVEGIEANRLGCRVAGGLEVQGGVTDRVERPVAIRQTRRDAEIDRQRQARDPSRAEDHPGGDDGHGRDIRQREQREHDRGHRRPADVLEGALGADASREGR